MAVVFITNAMLTAWSDQGKVRLDDTTLTLLQENRTVKLKPAVRFTKTIDGTPDPNKLLGKVKTKEQLHELKAEHYMDSVILGDIGYSVVEGFLGDLSPPVGGKAVADPLTIPPATIPPGAMMPPPPPKADEPKDATDAELLSKLFLTTVKD